MRTPHKAKKRLTKPFGLRYKQQKYVKVKGGIRLLTNSFYFMPCVLNKLHRCVKTRLFTRFRFITKAKTSLYRRFFLIHQKTFGLLMREEQRLFKNEWSFENDYDKINNIWDDVRLRGSPCGFSLSNLRYCLSSPKGAVAKF